MENNHRCRDGMERLEEKIDGLDYRIDLKLDKIETILESQHESLQLHMKRTTQIEQELLPIKAQQNQLIGAIKVISLLGVIASVGSFLLKIFLK